MKTNILKDFARVFKLMGKHKIPFILITMCIEIPNALLNVGIAFGMKQIADYFIDGYQAGLKNAIIIAILMVSLGCLYLPFAYYFGSKRAEKVMRDVRIKLFKHLQLLPVSYFENNHSGNILSRANKDMDALNNMLGTFRGLGWSIFSMVVIIPYIIGLDWRFGLISIITSLVATAVNIKFIIPMREKSKKIHDKTAVLTETISDNVTGFNVIKMYGLAGLFMSKFLKKLEEVVGYEFDRVKVAAIVYTSNIFISWANTGLLSIVGCLFVFNGSIEIGILVGTLPVCNHIAFAIINMSRNINSAQRHLAGTDRLYEVFNTDVELTNFKAKGNSPDSGVYFNNAKFGYEKDTLIINNLYIDVKKGKTAALVGDSGGGKSTIVKLVMGLYEIWDGEMVINGKPICEYSLTEMRNQVAYVPQDAFVFNGTIYENIYYGNTSATKEEILSAAKKANAHEFIIKQKNGYDTVVGERGIKLSGGQRQRIAIARAIVKNAPILLLDEATSSLDSESEHLVQQALDELMKNKTSIVVAHRLSTIEKADSIYFIQDGRVVEQGTHDELLESNGKYTELYMRDF